MFDEEDSMSDATGPAVQPRNPAGCGIERCMNCLSPGTFDLVPVAIAHVSLEGAILRVNKAFAELTGISERNLINTAADSLFAPRLTLTESRAIRNVIKGEIAETQMVKTFRRGDGMTLPVDVRYSAVRDTAGRAHCATIMLDPPPDAAARENLERIARVLSADTGEPFFRALLIELTQALGIDVAFIAEIVDTRGKRSRTVAACDRGQIIPNFDYLLGGTPADALLQYGVCSFPADVRKSFPNDADLQALEVEGYVGIRLESTRHEPLGLIVMLHRQPLTNSDQVQAMLRIFAPRVSAELERLRTEQELGRSERYLSEAQRIGHIGNWVWEPGENRIVGSEEAFRICGAGGHQRAVPTGEFFETVHPEDRREVREAFDRSLREGAPVELRFRVAPPNEPVRYVELRGELEPSLGARVARMHGTLQDVTEREIATEALRKLSMAVEQAGDQIVITDASGTIEYVNRAFETMTGYDRSEAIGKNPRIFKSGLQPPGFYRHLWSSITRGEVFRGVFINRKKNGEIYYEEKTITPIRDAMGEITKYVASGTDITERRQAEEEQIRLQDALKSAAAEWRTTFDSMQSAIVVLDSDGSIHRVNHAASTLLRMRPADLVGRRLEELVNQEPWSAVCSLVEALRQHRSIPSVQIRDGSSGTTWEVSLTFTGTESRSQVVVVVRDITKTVELQESLRRSETMSAMGALVAGVAHEARNPLFGISATLDAFEKSLRGGKSDPERYVPVLRRELARLNQLMHELLEYGRPLDLVLTDQRVAPLVDRAFESCKALASDRGVRLENAVEAEMDPIWCDAVKIEQAVRNLVENAVQHSAEGTSVIVRSAVDRRAHLAGCEVLDEGSGFDPHDLGEVFEPFFSRRRGGTGLGLAIVQRVVEQHGGRASASNRACGGARVELLLPIAEEKR
jgi:PAS domain S-box-containing protein